MGLQRLPKVLRRINVSRILLLMLSMVSEDKERAAETADIRVLDLRLDVQRSA